MTRWTLLLVVGAGCAQFHPNRVTLTADPTVDRVPPPPLIGFEVRWWSKPLIPTAFFEFQPRETATPAVDIDSERVVVSGRDGTIVCVEGANGVVAWKFKTHGRPFAGATILDGIAYVPSGDGSLYAIELSTGVQKWQYNAGEELVTAPTVAGNRVYIASQAETLFAVDRESGKWVWQYRREAPSGYSVRGTATPTVGKGLVYMGFADGAVVALTADVGSSTWERQLTQTGSNQFQDVDGLILSADGSQLFAASYRDGLYSLDPTTGSVLWKSPHAGLNGLVEGAISVFGTGDGNLTAFDQATGKETWSVDLSDYKSKGSLHNAGRPPAYAFGNVLAPTGSGLAFVSENDGTVFGVWDPGRGVTAAPMPVDSPHFGKRVYVMSNLGSVMALDFIEPAT